MLLLFVHCFIAEEIKAELRFVVNSAFMCSPAKQATHMHMHMICVPEILGISEIVKDKKIEYLQIFIS